MDTIETRSTSRHTALCTPIVLRETDTVRLVFLPALVDHPSNPKACVDGHFIYERKTKSNRWVPAHRVALSTLRAGEGFQLRLHATELRYFLENLVPLYRVYDQHGGIPRGKQAFVPVDLKTADNLKQISPDGDLISTFLPALIALASNAASRRKTAEQIAAVAAMDLPDFTALLGLASLKSALHHWRENQANDSEEFWHQTLTEHAFVLSQVFAYPVFFIKSKAYVGGKALSNTGGKVTDFLAAVETTGALILLELKTPQTQLLGREYRPGVFPLSVDLAGAVAQVLRGQQALMREFNNLTAEQDEKLTLGDPRCVVIAGHTAELTNKKMRENFEIHRERIRGVTVVTYDELFMRLERLISLLEGA
jgi:hypothetical protein